MCVTGLVCMCPITTLVSMRDDDSSVCVVHFARNTNFNTLQHNATQTAIHCWYLYVRHILYVWLHSFMCVLGSRDLYEIRLIHMRHVSFIRCTLYVWRHSFMCTTGLIHKCSLTCVRYLIHTCTIFHLQCGMSRSFVWHASFVGSMMFNLWRCRALLLRHTALLRTYWHAMCDMVHSHVWHDAFLFVTCLIHMCKMPHSYRDIVNVDSTVPASLNYITTLFLPQRVECLSTHICSYSALFYYRNRLFETVVLSLGHSLVVLGTGLASKWPNTLNIWKLYWETGLVSNGGI